MTPSRIVVVTIDGFGTAAAGAYGQTSLATPGWDALATSAATFDFVDAPASSREAIFDAFVRDRARSASIAATLARLIDRGFETTLAGDLADFAAGGSADSFAARFGKRTPFDLATPTAPARREDDTLAMRWLGRAEQAIEATAGDGRQLLWLHHRGGYGAWDAPLDWREALRDEEDPPPYDGVEPPSAVASAADDPDRFLPFAFAWAGQAGAWDRLGEALHLLWKRADAERPTALIVLGLRGFPLGEHGVVGAGDPNDPSREPSLFGEGLHVPAFVLPPGGAFPGMHGQNVRRSDELLARLLTAAATADEEGEDLAQLLEAETSGEIDPEAYALAVEGRGASVRTPTWRFVRDAKGSRLFLKPDDRWEANDVASRRRETVEAFESWLDEAARGETPPLPE